MKFSTNDVAVCALCTRALLLYHCKSFSPLRKIKGDSCVCNVCVWWSRGASSTSEQKTNCFLGKDNHFFLFARNNQDLIDLIVEFIARMRSMLIFAHPKKNVFGLLKIDFNFEIWKCQCIWAGLDGTQITPNVRIYDTIWDSQWNGVSFSSLWTHDDVHDDVHDEWIITSNMCSPASLLSPSSWRAFSSSICHKPNWQTARYHLTAYHIDPYAFYW